VPGCAQHHKRCPVVSLSPLCDVQVLRGRGVVHAGLNLDELSSSDEEREIGAGGSRTSRDCASCFCLGGLYPPPLIPISTLRTAPC
jgi:hypothetical protein